MIGFWSAGVPVASFSKKFLVDFEILDVLVDGLVDWWGRARDFAPAEHSFRSNGRFLTRFEKKQMFKQKSCHWDPSIMKSSKTSIDPNRLRKPFQIRPKSTPIRGLQKVFPNIIHRGHLLCHVCSNSKQFCSRLLIFLL